MQTPVLVEARVKGVVYQGCTREFRLATAARYHFVCVSLPKTPALLPTKLPRLVMLLRTVFNRSLKLGDLKAFCAAAAGPAFAAEGPAAVEAFAATSAAAVAPVAADPSVAAVADEAAALACCATLLMVGLAVMIFRDLARPSRRPQSPPAANPTMTMPEEETLSITPPRSCVYSLLPER